MTKCYICEKGDLSKQKVDFKLYGEIVGKFNAEVCSHCGEKFFDEETSNKIDDVTKKKGLWGLESETIIGQSGDSLMVRISKKLADFLNLHKGEKVKIRIEDRKKLVIET